jgi:myosin-5
MDIDPSGVTIALTMRQIEIQKKVINKPLSKADCYSMRDSWAKEIYERLFNWIVERLNLTIRAEGDDYLSIGLLDIYGFEVFDTNGFEQMMINYSNEKLHQLYILYVFKEEEVVFKREGLSQYYGQIKFHDNQ